LLAMAVHHPELLLLRFHREGSGQRTRSLPEPTTNLLPPTFFLDLLQWLGLGRRTEDLVIFGRIRKHEGAPFRAYSRHVTSEHLLPGSICRRQGRMRMLIETAKWLDHLIIWQGISNERVF